MTLISESYRPFLALLLATLWGIGATHLGLWGEHRWLRADESTPQSRIPSGRMILFTSFTFLAFLPTSLLSVIHVMIPFSGARAGLALAIAGYFFGCIPVRLFDIRRFGWDHTLWWLLADLVRICGALTIVGWLVAG